VGKSTINNGYFLHQVGPIIRFSQIFYANGEAYVYKNVQSPMGWTKLNNEAGGLSLQPRIYIDWSGIMKIRRPAQYLSIYVIFQLPPIFWTVSSTVYEACARVTSTVILH
jgi:hypothetical protein